MLHYDSNPDTVPLLHTAPPRLNFKPGRGPLPFPYNLETVRISLWRGR